MDDRSSQNKLITLFIHLFQSTFMSIENSILHSSGGIENYTEADLLNINFIVYSSCLWPSEDAFSILILFYSVSIMRSDVCFYYIQ